MRAPVKIAACPTHSLHIRGRNFLALVLAPDPPLTNWLANLDAWVQRSPGFFVGRPIILDVAALNLSKLELADLIADLHARDIRIMGVEGTDPSWLGLGMPPLVSNGRQAGIIEALESAPAGEISTPVQQRNSLLIDNPIRSGQSLNFPNGDVTIIGSVASGAEVIAGGSIHIYGALRGRASAGSTGDSRARIFCQKFEAELLAIDGLYTTVDSVEAHLRGRPVQAWLDRDTMTMMMVPLG
jgi:septum site-determining protein MinC